MIRRGRQWLRAGGESQRLLLGGIALCCGGLIVWANLAQIDQVVRVEGRIIPSGRNKEIQHFEGGIIASIATSEGAVVKRGDLLLTIDNTSAGASLSETEVKMNSARARAIRLEAEIHAESKPVFPPDLAALPVATEELKLFMTRQAKLSQDLAVHQNVIKQRQAEITEAGQQQGRLTTELATAEQRVKMLEQLAAQGAAGKLEVMEAQSRAQRLHTEIGEAAGKIPKAKAAINEEQARMAAVRGEFQEQAQNALVETVADIEQLKQVVATAADRLKRTEIRAPIDGIINRVAVNTVGGVVKPGATLIELTPHSDGVLIEAKSQPRDRGYLRSGLPAKVRISAYDASQYGLLSGRVTEVSADSLRDEEKQPFYQVNVKVDDIPDGYIGRTMVPGMMVTADIVTGQRTILSYLLSPLLKFSSIAFRDPK